jgi:hypothetical protein
MKIDNDNTTLATSRDLENHAMGIDPKHMSHIINLLTDAYSNPIQAVIREYSANALDALREAGIKEPVRVTLPTALKPLLTIEDAGIGLDKDEIIQVYAQYGASTKRDTNEQIGGFGIGAKSAFAVSDQFTVIAVKDGMQTSVVFTRTSEGGSVNILRHAETDAPNGVKVVIPIPSDYHRYAEEAQNIFQYWAKEDVIVEGTDIDHLLDEAFEITPTVFALSRAKGYSHDPRMTIRMGGIGYKLDYDEKSYLGLYDIAEKLNEAEIELLLDTPIGTVDLVPSREKLMMNEKGRKTILALIENAKEALAERYQSFLNEQTTLLDAVRYYYQNKSTLDAFLEEKIWQGQELPMQPANEIAIAVAKIDGKRVKVHKDVDWKNVHRPVFIIDTGDTPLKAGKFSYKPGRYHGTVEIDGTAEQVALLDGKRGVVRRHMSAYLRSIKDTTLPCGTQVRNYSDNIFVLAHEVGDDPAILARTHVRLKLDDMVKSAKSFQAANRPAKGTTAAIGGGITYATIEGKFLNVSEIAEHDHIYHLSMDGARTLRRGDLDFYEPHLPDNHVIIVLRNTQKTDAFLNRVKKATEGKRESKYWTSERREIVQRLVDGLNDAERTYVEREQHGGGQIYDNVLKPIHEGGLITSSRFSVKLNNLMQSVSLTDERIDELDALMRQSSRIGITIGEGEDPFNTLVDEYPILKLASRSVNSWNKIDKDEDVLDTVRQAIVALDYMADHKAAEAEAA